MSRRVLFLCAFSIFALIHLSCSDKDSRGPTSHGPISGAPPTVTLNSPEQGARIGNYVVLTATAHDDLKVWRVVFYVDSAEIGSDTTAPYSYPWYGQWASNGSEHTFFARAFDHSLQGTSSATVACTVDSTLWSPAKVIATTCGDSTTSSFRICWTKNNDPDFKAYQVVYGKNGQSNPTEQWVYGGNRNDTTFVIKGLIDGTNYWCVVRVVDLANHASLSDTIHQVTANAPAQPPFTILVNQTGGYVSLKWLISPVHDFASYVITRGPLGSAADGEIVAEILRRDSLTVRDYSGDIGEAYDYRVHVRDTFGLIGPGYRIATKMLADGTSGYALDYIGDYCVVPYYPELDLTQEYTIEAWVKTKNASYYRMAVVDKVAPEGTYFQYTLWMDEGRLCFGHCFGDYYDRLNGNILFPAGTWQHYAVAFSGDSLRFYLNGNLYYADRAEPITCVLTSDLNFGRRSLYEEWGLLGQIDEIRIWNIARTQEEIFNDLDRSLTGNESGLVGYWQFDDGSGDVVTARKGNNGHLGTSEGPDDKDPIWVPSTAPIRY